MKNNDLFGWEDHEVEEYMDGIQILVHERIVDFMAITPNDAPVIELNNTEWFVKTLKVVNDEEKPGDPMVELSLSSNDNTKTVKLTSKEIGQKNAFILLLACFLIFNEADELGYEDVWDFYGWELS